MDDKGIIDLFWQRSEDAISTAEEAYGNLRRTIARNLLPSEEDVRECVNDTWHCLWNAIPPERPVSLMAYIVRITRNLAMKRLTYLSTAKRQAATVSFDELDQCIPDPQSG